jgi:hypothetical protein
VVLLCHSCGGGACQGDWGWSVDVVGVVDIGEGGGVAVVHGMMVVEEEYCLLLVMPKANISEC